MMKFFKYPLICAILVCSTQVALAKENTAYPQGLHSSTNFKLKPLDKIERVHEWTIYKELPFVRIEYRFEECNSKSDWGFSNSNMAFLRVTNLSSNTIELKWVYEIYYNDKCHNCDELDNPEHARSIILQANETKQGNCEGENRELSVFGNFVKLVPGMSGTSMTDFKLRNIDVKTVN